MARVVKLALKVIAVGCVGGAGYVYAEHPRTFKLWMGLGPVITHYRLLELKQKYYGPTNNSFAADLEWAGLHEKYAAHVLHTIQDLRGFYVKVGQYISSRNDLLPDVYVEKLRTLEDQVPHDTDSATILDLMKRSLGVGDLKDVFRDLDVDHPIGTASIGQVFKGRLKESRENVAIKVQTPGIEHLFRGDLQSARAFCSVMAPEQVVIFDEIEKQFMTEFDYRKEAEQLEQVRQNMRRFRGEVVVPKPILKHCTKEVLVMEYLPGPKLIDGIREAGRRWAAKQGIEFEELQRRNKAKYVEEGLPPPYSGPGAGTLEMYRTLLKIRDEIVNYPIWLYNTIWQPLFGVFTLGLLTLPKAPYFKSFIPLNSSRIMDTLLKVHGHQLLADGVFNADPHPGNFLLLPDERIGLIDYGQVKRLSAEERHDMVRIVAAMYRMDRERLLELVKKNGYKSKYNNPDVICKMVVVCLDQDGRDVTDGLNFQQFLDKMFEIDPWEKSGNLVIMPTRLSFLLRGIGLMMNHPVSVLRVWGPMAENILKRERLTY